MQPRRWSALCNWWMEGFDSSLHTWSIHAIDTFYAGGMVYLINLPGHINVFFSSRLLCPGWRQNSTLFFSQGSLSISAISNTGVERQIYSLTWMLLLFFSKTGQGGGNKYSRAKREAEFNNYPFKLPISLRGICEWEKMHLCKLYTFPPFAEFLCSKQKMAGT